MTKNKFLKELDKSLYVLAEVERTDIINEYRDIIEEKVKHGKTEKEAVEEFGSIDELSREILSAYKVNPDYTKKDDEFTESAKKLGNDFDSFVKKGAKKATEFTKEVVEEIKQNNNEITIEFVFELLFKGVAALIIMFIASLPFMIVREIGESILNVVVYPINDILIIIWSLLLTILFVGCCGLIFIAMFKQYFSGKNKNVAAVKETNSDSKEVKNDIKEDITVKSETKKEEKIVEENEPKKVNKVDNKRENKQKNGTPLLDIFLAIAKAVMVVLILPLVFFNIATGIGIAITIYLMIKGLVIPGFLIILIATLMFFGSLQSLLFNVIFKQKKIYFSPFIIAIVIGIVGGIMCFDQVLSMNYYDYAPKVDFKLANYSETIIVNSNQIYIENWDTYNDTEYKIDPTLKDNEVKIDVTNYPELSSVKIDDRGILDYYNGTNMHTISIHRDRVSLLSKSQKEMNKIIIKNFNDKKIYNYDELSDAKITIYTNGKLIINGI